MRHRRRYDAASRTVRYPTVTGILPDPTTYALFLAAAVALILTPGPDTLFVLSQGIQSRSLGVRAALGVSAGVLLHTALAVIGLAAIYRTVPAAEGFVRLVGGTYLIYLGVTTLGSAEDDVPGNPTDDDAAGAPMGDDTAGVPTGDTAGNPTGDDTAGSPPPGERRNPGGSRTDLDGGFGRGFLVNALNPQVALFFLAFLPGFASGSGASVRMAFLGGTYATITGLYLVGVATLTDGATRVISAPGTRTRLDRVAGTVLLALGGWFLFDGWFRF